MSAQNRSYLLLSGTVSRLMIPGASDDRTDAPEGDFIGKGIGCNCVDVDFHGCNHVDVHGHVNAASLPLLVSGCAVGVAQWKYR